MRTKSHYFFDKTHRDPCDRTAASVVSGGERHSNVPKMDNCHWLAPPPMRKPEQNAPPLVGLRFGRFVVVGLHAEIRGAWIVRCDCGDYETRRSRAIRNPNNFGDRCTLCRNAAHQKKDYEFRTHGRELDRREL